MSAIIIWVAIAIICIVADLCTSLFMFSWVSIGSLGAIICNLCGLNIWIQVIVFCVISLISIIIGYNLITKNIKKSVKPVKLMEETFIGQTFTAEDDISDKVSLKLEGSYWTCVNEGEKISKGQKFQITGIKGTKLLIQKC